MYRKSEEDSGYIYPYLGEKRLDEINVNTIIGFRNYLAEGKKHGFKTNLHQKSIEDRHRTVRPW